jgi:hypothetical protein
MSISFKNCESDEKLSILATKMYGDLTVFSILDKKLAIIRETGTTSK